jgi:hypothetical protein
MQTDPLIYSQNCSNCGTGLIGKFCYKCGQKKIELHDRSLKSFAVHFVEEFFTFDSRFYRSLKSLFFKPGYLTLEYISGRFVRYVSPLKMYLFTSLITLFILIKLDPDQYTGLMEPRSDDDIFQMSIRPIMESKEISENEFKEKFNEHVNDMTAFGIFFIMVAFSMILKLMYINKHIYYVEHLVFTLHYFTIVLILFTVGFILSEIVEPDILNFFVFIFPCIYLFFAVKKVYHQRWIWSVFTSALLSFAYWILLFLWAYGTMVVGALRV